MRQASAHSKKHCRPASSAPQALSRGRLRAQLHCQRTCSTRAGTSWPILHFSQQWSFHVSQIIGWQIDRLKLAGLPVLLFVDEPALCLDAPAAIAVSEEQRLDALAATLEHARVRGAHAGLHCCAARPFERMCRVQPDIISFDAHEGLDSFFADWHALNFMQQGGTVAYGIVPTRPGVNAVDSASIFLRWLKAASLAGDPQKFAQRAMITATCGLGLLDTSAVAESFGVAHSVSKLIRSLAGSPELDEEIAFGN